MLSGMGLRQHVVEFTTSGLFTDGVLTTAGAGPFSWLVPQGVCELGMNAMGAGGGGSAGYGLTTQRAGGGAGGTGLMFHGALLPVIPSTTLQITLGTGGLGGLVGGSATSGGASFVAGLGRMMGSTDGVPGKIQISGGNRGGNTGSSYGGDAAGIYGSSAGVNANNVATPGTAVSGDAVLNLRYPSVYGGTMLAMFGGSGGAASTVGTTSGGSGGNQGRQNGGTIPYMIFGPGGTTPTYGGAGNTDGTNSYGGGGAGPSSFYGSAGQAGAGNAAAGTGYGYGYGGAGGGGNAAGGAGGDAYIRFVYWSTD